MTRVADLTGAELALWVARAEVYKDAHISDGLCLHSRQDGDYWTIYAPHSC